jgi:hypothetical protein
MTRSFRHLVEIPSDSTMGEILEDIQAIAKDEDEEAAETYKAMLVRQRIRALEEPESVEESELVVASNIGYVSGYCSFEERQRICRVFSTTHPIFGDTSPTPEEAFQMGKDMMAEILREAEENGEG